MGVLFMFNKSMSTALGAIALAGAVGFGATAAQAGGLPPDEGSLKDTGYAAPAVDWTGFYVGALGSYVSAETDFYEFDFEDAMVGGTVGYNFQHRNIVFGVEGDASFGEMSDFVRDGNFIVGSGEFDQLFTLRGRIGYSVGRWLPFVTAGVMWGKLSLKQSCSAEGAIGASSFCDGAQFQQGQQVPVTYFDEEQTHVGWIAGGGVEYSVSDRWSIKGEVLTGEFGNETYDVDSVASPFSYDVDLDLDAAARLGVNARF
jgi:outer membrane immunogenic protein